MDFKNLISALGLFSSPPQQNIEKNEQQNQFSSYFPADVLTPQNENVSCLKDFSSCSLSDLNNFQQQNQPPLNQGGLSLQTFLPFLLLAISGKTNVGQILSKISALSPELKNLEPLTKLLTKNEEKPSSPSIDSYKRIQWVKE